jgi:hypothetical protein
MSDFEIDDKWLQRMEVAIRECDTSIGKRFYMELDFCGSIFTGQGPSKEVAYNDLVDKMVRERDGLIYCLDQRGKVND